MGRHRAAAHRMRGGGLFWACPLLLVPLLAACAGPADGLPDRGAVLDEVMRNYRASLIAVSGENPLPAGAAGGTAGPAAVQPVVALRPGTPPASVASLRGQTGPAVRAALGEPVFRRAEGPAEIWLYSGQRCQLDLILYPAEREMLVAWAAARAAGTDRVTEEACLREVGGRVPGA
ncbi:hypothetical protein [Roseomonas gilardii]|uniref:hypothetical protein n=1 Tax=Roseomonas gilardii TaxID=257708 RepID=UPI0021B68325|nr:hypothetical protein [Roseomonas gilardii]